MADGKSSLEWQDMIGEQERWLIMVIAILGKRQRWSGF
jgi:hypothetical protein